MESKAPFVVSSRRLLRGPFRRVGGLVTLAVFVAGVALAAPVPKAKTKKKEEAKKELKTQPDEKDKSKKSDADKEIDKLLDEMTRNMMFGDAAAAKRMREQMRQNLRNLPAEQRKQMLAMMRRAKQPGFPAAAVPAFAGFGSSRANARLGVRVEPPSETLVEQLNLPKGQGLVVRNVLPASAAAKAGLKRHDVLLELDGKAVPNRVVELARRIADIKADTAVEVVVLRKGKKQTIKAVKLPEAKSTPPGFPGGGFPGGGGGFPPGGGFPGAFNPPALGRASSLVTTMVHTQDRFTLRHQEGSLIITLTGKTVEGKPKIKRIHVQEGGQSHRYESVDKVPEQYRDKVKNLIEMSEKGSMHIEIKSP